MTLTVAPVNSMDDNGLIAALEEQVLQLIDHEGWLDVQIRELEFANENDTASIHNDERSADDVRKDLEKRIDYLKQELALAVSMDTIRTKVFDSAHGYQVVLKSFFKGEQDPDEKAIASAIQERDDTVSEYLHIHEELQQTRRELSSIQKQVLDSQDENRKLAQLLSQETAAMKDDMASQDSGSNRRMAQRLEEDLKTIAIKHDVVSNVLQGLLLESDIDWANDPHYLEVMLKIKRTED